MLALVLVGFVLQAVSGPNAASTGARATATPTPTPTAEQRQVLRSLAGVRTTSGSATPVDSCAAGIAG